MTETKLLRGNEVIAYAAIKAGCKFYAGYPITPQNEIPETMSVLMPEANGIFIQAEAEISAINMLFGAAATGTRCMTSSSSPGISLKQEGISYIAAANLPCVIVNMVRGGPGLGDIRAAQSDYFQSVKSGGHGDYHMIVLAPSTLQEIYQLTMDAFDYADFYKTPVLILGDGILGQMFEPVELTDYKPILSLPSKKEWILDGCKARPKHVIKTYHGAKLQEINLELEEKYKKINDSFSLCKEYKTDDAELIITAYGITARIAKEAVDIAREKGIKIGLIQPITLWPFPKKNFVKYSDKEFLVIEMSHGQFIEDVKLALDCKPKIHFLGHGGGWYPDTNIILEKIQEIL